MRLWTLHPRYLDSKGLVALWREGLLARAVLAGATTGYRNHPQLVRFKGAADPGGAIDAYLHAVADEADARRYRFRRGKLGRRVDVRGLRATAGQMEFERVHLKRKLAVRQPAAVAALCAADLDPHPIFVICDGPIAAWERGA